MTDTNTSLITDFRQERERINQLPPADRFSANQVLQKKRNHWVKVAQHSYYQLALNNSTQANWLRFWFNHFNVFWRKGIVGIALTSYLNDALSPNLSSAFEQLLRAVITHPAMLSYLDNVQNNKGKINENLARELLELHTLGSSAGYTQTDVQAVAYLLTGLGFTPLKTEAREKNLAMGGIEFSEVTCSDQRKHDIRAVTVIGVTFASGQFQDLQQLLTVLAEHPSTAQHLAQKLCSFYLGEQVSPTVVMQISQAWQQTKGDLAHIFSLLRHHPQAQLTFKDPQRYVFSSLKLLALNKPLEQPERISSWLNQLGQPLFSCLTPNGYSLKGSDWQSSGQLTQRFTVAKEMIERLPTMFKHQANTVWQHEETQQLLKHKIGQQTQRVIQQQKTPEEKLALLLSSPEWMYGFGWGES